MGVHEENASLYHAIYGDNFEEVIERCKENALRVLTIHKDTVLHIAIWDRKFELANELLDNLSPNLYEKLDVKNNWGNTILHNSCNTNNEKAISFAKKLLHKAPPRLLPARNRWGESAVFAATRYGKRKTLEFLCGEVDKYCQITRPGFDKIHFFRRDDNSTILHLSILVGEFDMAFMIATRYPFLSNLQDRNKMTASQILACTPTAFKSGTKLGFVKKLIYNCVSIDEQGRDAAGQTGTKISKAPSFLSKFQCISPVFEEIRGMKREHETAVKLANILVKNDTSWENTCEPGAELNPPVVQVIETPAYVPIGTQSPSKQAQEKYDKDESETISSDDVLDARGKLNDVGGGEAREQDGHKTDKKKFINPDETPLLLVARNGCVEIVQDGHKTDKKKFINPDETPLMLAARNGCIEIVKEILDVYPQTVEYLNKNGQNLLHVAAENGHSDVIELVRDKNLHFKALMSSIDKEGNSILHKFGSNIEALDDVKMDGPVVRLSKKLLLLEHMKDICPRKIANYNNHDLMTADELFAVNNDKLRNEAKDWLKRTAEQCTVVIVLIATVAFAAAYTIPGGPNQTTGIPVLLAKPFFLVFTLTDVLSLAFALTAVVIFLSILTSSFQFKDFKRSLPQKLLLGFSLLFLSVSMMMVSFAATVILMIHNKGRWTQMVIYAVAFFPVSIFMLSYIPIYIQLAKAFKYWVIEISKYVPRSKVSPRLRAVFNNSASSSCAADHPV